MSTEPTPLQFDNAEYGGGAAAPTGIACAACKRSIVDQYYEAVSKVFCGNCAAVIKAGPKGGSRIGRVISSLLLGAMGGAIGAFIWYLIRSTTGYTLGLIAILVGVFVGAGVRKGSRGRGGWFYQLMAILLTYGAIASAYVPLLIQANDKYYRQIADAAMNDAGAPIRLMITQDGKVKLDGEDATPQQWRDALDKAKAEKKPVFYFREGRVKGATPPPIADEVMGEIDNRELYALSFQNREYTHPFIQTYFDDEQSAEEKAYLLANVYFDAFLHPIKYAKQNPITLFIIAIALYEAWKINKKLQIAIAGPFVISPAVMGQGSIVHVPPRSGGATALSDPFASPPVPGDPPQGPASP